jgi:S1-C subfamily serine protease
MAGAPAPLAAQDEDGDGEVRAFSFVMGRPRIGVTVDNKADKDQDKIGARISSVVADGPAEKAGLKAGDIITRFNGVALGGLKGEDEDESGPGRKLVELARKLDAGDTVEVEYRRGNESKKTIVVAQDLSRHGSRHFHFEMPDLPRMRWEGGELPRGPMMLEGGPGGFRMFTRRLGGLELADLNPELGEYFGAKEGVLVLSTPKDSTLALKAGDVILSIDGRTPTSEAHAHRILGSYDGGETAKLEILRRQKKLTVSWKVPEREWKWREPGQKRKVKVERS